MAAHGNAGREEIEIMDELARRRLDKAGHTICVNVVVLENDEHLTWQPYFVQEQLEDAGVTREEFALTLETIADALRDAEEPK